MTRYSYAGGSADFVFDIAPNGYLRLRPATLLVFGNEVGGARVTDLRLGGVAVDSIPVADTGQVPTFQGPDEFAGDLWAATGPDKPRVRLISNAESTQAETAAAAAIAAAARAEAAGPGLVDLVTGYLDHGTVSGPLTIDPAIGTHVLDASGVTTLTVGPADDGVVITIRVCSGGDDIAWANADFDSGEPDGGLFTISLLRTRDAWVAPSSSGGTPAVPDTSPPSAVTDLAAVAGDDGDSVTLTFTAATDAESTVKYRARIYETGDTAPAWPTSGPLYNLASSPVVATGLDGGTAYTVELHAYSMGGASAYDSATFTTPIALTTMLTDTFTGANGLLSGHIAETGQAWSGSTGIAQISSGQLVINNVNIYINHGAAARSVTFDVTLAAGEMVAVWGWASGNSQVSSRCLISQNGQHSFNNLAVTYNASGGFEDYTPVGFLPLTAGTTHAIEMKYDGALAGLYIDGVKVIEGSPSASMTGQQISATGTGRIDNLVVKAG